MENAVDGAAWCAERRCDDDKTWKLADWVTRSFDHVTNYDDVYWSGCYGGSPPSCTFVNPAHPGAFRSYEAGFRCCL